MNATLYLIALQGKAFSEIIKSGDGGSFPNHSLSLWERQGEGFPSPNLPLALS
jgi:hypothetical protein